MLPSCSHASRESPTSWETWRDLLGGETGTLDLLGGQEGTYLLGDIQEHSYRYGIAPRSAPVRVRLDPLSKGPQMKGFAFPACRRICGKAAWSNFRGPCSRPRPRGLNLQPHPVFGLGNDVAVRHGSYARLQLSKPAAETYGFGSGALVRVYGMCEEGIEARVPNTQATAAVRVRTSSFANVFSRWRRTVSGER